MPGLSHAQYPAPPSPTETDVTRAAAEQTERVRRARERNAAARDGAELPMAGMPNLFGRSRPDAAAPTPFVAPLPGSIVWVHTSSGPDTWCPALLVEVLPAGADVGRVAARAVAYVSRPDSDLVDTRLLELAIVADRDQAIAMSKNAARPVAASLA